MIPRYGNHKSLVRTIAMVVNNSCNQKKLKATSKWTREKKMTSGYIMILITIIIIIKVQILKQFLKPNSTNNFKLAWFVMLNIESMV